MNLWKSAVYWLFLFEMKYHYCLHFGLAVNGNEMSTNVEVLLKFS